MVVKTITLGWLKMTDQNIVRIANIIMDQEAMFRFSLVAKMHYINNYLKI